jgi:hypothetical protein
MPQSPGVITSYHLGAAGRWAHGAWRMGYGMELELELEPPEPPRAAVMAPGPEKLSRPAGSTEHRAPVGGGGASSQS